MMKLIIRLYLDSLVFIRLKSFLSEWSFFCLMFCLTLNSYSVIGLLRYKAGFNLISSRKYLAIKCCLNNNASNTGPQDPVSNLKSSISNIPMYPCTTVKSCYLSSFSAITDLSRLRLPCYKLMITR